MLLICFLMMAAVAINRDRKLFGYGQTKKSTDKVENKDTFATRRVLADGTVVINTSSIGRDIHGYGGIVPLEISIKDDRIVDIRALKNSETPDFFARASELFTQWKGKSLSEATEMNVDGVSGATFSSKAIIGNMKAGLQYASKSAQRKASFSDGSGWTAKTAIVLLIALIAAVLPLFVHNKIYRIIQMLLNVLVLGLWSGTFISYSLIVGYLSNGINLITSLPIVLLLITAFVYPLFGKHQYYCTNVCPFGSLQQLAGMCNKGHKVRLSPVMAKRLMWFRRILWALLMLCLWGGVLFEWMDYELFTAFIFTSASWAVITIAVLFILLSAFVTRPYCRFVCPTGTLLKLSENI